MGVSVHIEGFRDATDDYRKKAAVWHACDAAGVDPPPVIDDYFDGEVPSDDGMPVDIDDCIEGRVEYNDGAIIDVGKLPDGVTKIRVRMS